jgi:hypothetical protein
MHTGVHHQLRVDSLHFQRLVEQLGVEDGHVPIDPPTEKQSRCFDVARAQQRRMNVVFFPVLPGNTQLPEIPPLVDVVPDVCLDQAMSGARGSRLESRRSRDLHRPGHHRRPENRSRLQLPKPRSRSFIMINHEVCSPSPAFLSTRPFLLVVYGPRDRMFGFMFSAGGPIRRR